MVSRIWAHEKNISGSAVSLAFIHALNKPHALKQKIKIKISAKRELSQRIFLNIGKKWKRIILKNPIRILITLNGNFAKKLGFGNFLERSVSVQFKKGYEWTFGKKPANNVYKNMYLYNHSRNNCLEMILWFCFYKKMKSEILPAIYVLPKCLVKVREICIIVTRTVVENILWAYYRQQTLLCARTVMSLFIFIVGNTRSSSSSLYLGAGWISNNDSC